MNTDRLKSAIAILILCSAAALSLSFPDETERIRRRGAELLENTLNYREYAIQIGKRLGRADIGSSLAQTLEIIESGLYGFAESEK